METIGIICEYNPFHNGHIHHINEIKNKYPDSIIILVLNGYFLERGEISILSKYDKTEISLQHGIDLVVELPALLGTQSADTFAYASVYFLNKLGVKKIIFGSESNDIQKLKRIAKESNSKEYNEKIKELLDKGFNYPTALAKSLKTKFSFLPNDLLGISYVKAINKVNKNIEPDTIQRTNNYLDIESNEEIVSASNIRWKLKNDEDIKKYLPQDAFTKILDIDSQLYFNLLKISILNNPALDKILDVDEGIEHRLYEAIKKVNNLEELITYTKSKRYTYNKINRMFIHIILGITKKDAKAPIEYLKILGLNRKGRDYLNSMKKQLDIAVSIKKTSRIYEIEMKAALIYDMLTNSNNYEKELSNKPIII